ncbi:glycosyltransferase family 2 protein [Paenibacillus sp. JMULE4]|uniref:glycosyltransferase family 2 protein n=1 Tax=Paenibacillus sp. JMULE4 TaxID=2518342 RepID=UPI0015776EDD|nr:glycosyltransferase family 2 protein [Paenibacillus sp. JMULE4]NTZ20253.1 glycosyltransferase family 2 protein [Paenibacillus sp. JMULE4]
MDFIREVSVILPVFNEEKHISGVLESLNNQDFEGFIEIVIVDGNSSDKTLEIVNEMSKKLKQNRIIKIYSNPKRYIPISLNIACLNASFDTIVRLDGHTYAPSNYVSEAIKSLERIDFNGIVGGVWNIKPNNESDIAKAISIAVSHPAGVGNALYRTYREVNNELLEVDTVPFGAFTKQTWKALNGYDEFLLANEDYDFNFRAKKMGYKIVLNPSIVLEYLSRPSYGTLLKQYYRYGYWVSKFLIKHKVFPTVRKLAPISFLFLLSLFCFVNFTVCTAILSFYLFVIAAISLHLGLIKRKSLKLSLLLFPIFPILHFSYGIGNLIGLIKSVKITTSFKFLDYRN